MLTKLEELIGKGHVLYDEPMKKHTSFKIGGTADKFVKVTNEEELKEAIKYAIKNAQNGDIIVLAGKGHEDYQEIKGVKYPMDERVLIKEVVKELESGNVDLDNAINKYTEAMKIAGDCSKKLDEAEKAVNKIVNENGTMSDFNVEE